MNCRFETNKCFECESSDDIHHHHVVPRSIGGTKTIPLCARCHGLVHGRDMTLGAMLTKQALAKRRANGLRGGGDLRIGTCIAADGETLEANADEQRAIELVVALRSQGLSLRAIVGHLEGAGIKPRGARWHATTVNRILKHAATMVRGETCVSGGPA